VKTADSDLLERKTGLPVTPMEDGGIVEVLFIVYFLFLSAFLQRNPSMIKWIIGGSEEESGSFSFRRSRRR
jgi:hypothetical protein